MSDMVLVPLSECSPCGILRPLYDSLSELPVTVDQRRARKKDFKISPAWVGSPARDTSGRWWQVGWVKKRGPCSTAPPLGSSAANTTRATRARLMAPAHMAQGSSVT